MPQPNAHISVPAKPSQKLLMFISGEYERPYPSVMIWKIQIYEEESYIEDMQLEDAWILRHVWKEWLMLEGADAEYIPPKQFLVMQGK